MDAGPISVLLIEEGGETLSSPRLACGDPGQPSVEVVRAESLEEGLEKLLHGSFDVIVLDLDLPRIDESDPFVSVHANAQGVPIVLLTGDDDVDLAVEKLQQGAQDYLVKGRTDGNTLHRSLRYAIERQRLRHELGRYASELQSSEARFRRIIETSVDGMVIVNRRGLVLFTNRAATELLGTRQQELAGEVFPHRFVPGERTEVELPPNDAGGKPVFVELRAVEMELYGEAVYLVSLRDITELVQLHEELCLMSFIDELTGVHNRRGFFTLAERELAVADRTGRSMLLFFVDLDDMKGINDALGHKDGDRALVQAAAILKASFRKTDVIARIGGDEFAILALETAEDSGEVMVGKLQQAVDRRNAGESDTFQLSLSMGDAQYDPASPCTIDELLARADKLMYEEKRKRHHS